MPLFVCVIEGVSQSLLVSPFPKPLQIGRSLSAGMADLQPGLCPVGYGSHMLFLAWFPCSVSRAESFVASFPCGSFGTLCTSNIRDWPELRVDCPKAFRTFSLP